MAKNPTTTTRNGLAHKYPDYHDRFSWRPSSVISYNMERRPSYIHGAIIPPVNYTSGDTIDLQEEFDATTIKFS